MSVTQLLSKPNPALRTPHSALVQRILVIGLSNIGDTILMSPVIERLHSSFPQASLTLLVGERSRALFTNDPRVQRVGCMEEFEGLMGRLRLVRLVWQVQPDLLVDLRQTLLPLLWRPWEGWRYVWPIPRRVVHMRARHLWRLTRQAPHVQGAQEGNGRAVWIPQETREAVEQVLKRWEVNLRRPLVVISPGARSHIKRWGQDHFAALADRLIEDVGVEVVFTGEPEEASVIQEALKVMRHRAHNAVGRTSIQQLAALMQRARLVITNDSASLHLACAVGTLVLALFGPTDPRKYGPTGAHDRVIQRRLFCVPCEQALCRFNHECMRFITVEEVSEAARQMLESGTWNVERGRTAG